MATATSPRQKDPARSAAAKKAAATRKKNAQAKAQASTTQLPREPQSSQSLRDRFGSRFPIMAIAFIVIAIVVLVIVSISGEDTQSNKAQTPQVSAQGQSAEDLSAIEAAQLRYQRMRYGDFKALATPAKDHSRNGRFIDRKVNGLSPVKKLDALLRSAAEDKVTLVGLSQTLMKGLYSRNQLNRIRKAPQTSKVRYRAWSALRNRLTAAGAGIAGIKLNGRWYNTSVNASGVVGSRPANWDNEPGTKLQLASITANGKTLPAETVYLRDICANVQTKERTQFTPRQGKPVPPGVNIPPRKPGRPSKPQTPLRDIPSTHNGGRGKNLPPASERQYQGPPRRVIKQNPPVVTPPDRGGSYRPGTDPPPQNDSGGGTVQQPTAPPTPKPDPGPGSTPPPPPEQGAPPCC